MAALQVNVATEFLQINNGGTAQVTTGDAAEGAFLMLGMTPGTSGTLAVSGGTMTLGELRVGGRETINSNLSDWTTGTNNPNGGGTGHVEQTGGTISITAAPTAEPPVQSLYIGDGGLTSGNTAVGSYRISNNAVLISGIATNDGITVGTGVGSVGSFTQLDTSSVTSTGFVIVGRRGATGTYNMSGGTLAAAGSFLYVGHGESTLVPVGATQATFTQSGGTVNVATDVEIGRLRGNGTYNLSAGSLNITGSLIVGGGNGIAANTDQQIGNGNFNLSGTGQLTIGGNFNTGLSNATLVPTSNTVTGAVTMTGGSVSFTAAGAIWAIGNGRSATGSVNQSGGVVNLVGATAQMDIGRNNSFGGSYALSGTGILNATQIGLASSTFATAGTRSFNMTGGTLNATTFTFGANASTAPRTLSISGGTALIGNLNLGGDTNSNGRFVISGAPTFIGIDTLSLASTSQTIVSTSLELRNRANSAGTSITVGTAEVQVTGANNLTFSGPITNASRTLTKTGTGTLHITGLQTNSGTATITVNDGTLNMLSNGGTSLTVTNNATSNFTGTQQLKQLTMGSAGTANVPLGSALTVGTLAINGGTIVDNGTLTGDIVTGTGTLTKSGTGVLILSGNVNNTHSGLLRIGQGEVDLNKTAATAVAGDSQIDTTGILKLLQSNQIADTSKMTLAGGTFQTANNSETLAELILNENSTIDLGSGTAGVLQFANSSGQTWTAGKTLSITNWSGSPSGGGAEQIKFDASNTSLTAQQLGQVQFINPASAPPGTYAAIFSSSNPGELVPLVPEPASIATLAIAAILPRRRRRR